MSIIVFLTMSLALWHFTAFVPDRFWQGILGSLGLSLVGGVLSGIVLQTLLGRGIGDVDLLTIFLPLPGVFLLLFLSYSRS